MTDARFPERWLNDRRVLRLPDDAFRLFVLSLAWSVANRTDGVLKDDDLPLIPGYSPEPAAALTSAACGSGNTDTRSTLAVTGRTTRSSPCLRRLRPPAPTWTTWPTSATRHATGNAASEPATSRVTPKIQRIGKCLSRVTSRVTSRSDSTRTGQARLTPGLSLSFTGQNQDQDHGPRSGSVGNPISDKEGSGLNRSVANSQKPRVHNGTDSPSSDAQHIPAEENHQSQAADRNARASGGQPPSDATRNAGTRFLPSSATTRTAAGTTFRQPSAATAVMSTPSTTSSPKGKSPAASDPTAASSGMRLRTRWRHEPESRSPRGRRLPPRRQPARLRRIPHRGLRQGSDRPGRERPRIRAPRPARTRRPARCRRTMPATTSAP